VLQNYVVPGLQLHASNFKDLYFMQDGAPAHFADIVPSFLNETFPSRVIWKEQMATPLDLTQISSSGICLRIRYT